MMRVATLALHGFREQARSKAFLLILMFGGVMVYASLLLGVLAVDQEHRVLLDAGLALIELTALFGAIYGAATSILQEMESKTIYLVLTRPISKSQYLLGRFGGLVLTSLFAVAAMAVVHATLLLLKGAAVPAGYAGALAGIGLKIVVAAALATFFAMISTSVVSAVSMTGFMWLVGHFLPEIAFLVRRGGSWFLKPTLYLVPNLQLLNFRDRLDLPAAAAQATASFGASIGYALLYSAAALALSLCFFERKEF